MLPPWPVCGETPNGSAMPWTLAINARQPASARRGLPPPGPPLPTFLCTPRTPAHIPVSKQRKAVGASAHRPQHSRQPAQPQAQRPARWAQKPAMPCGTPSGGAAVAPSRRAWHLKRVPVAKVGPEAEDLRIRQQTQRGSCFLANPVSLPRARAQPRRGRGTHIAANARTLHIAQACSCGSASCCGCARPAIRANMGHTHAPLPQSAKATGNRKICASAHKATGEPASCQATWALHAAQCTRRVIEPCRTNYAPTEPGALASLPEILYFARPYLHKASHDDDACNPTTGLRSMPHKGVSHPSGNAMSVTSKV